MISIRKLAALDIAFLGSRLVIAEFAVGVVGPLGLAVLTFLRSHTTGGRLFGAYLLSLALNYVPLLWHAVSITRSQSALSEIGGDSVHARRQFAKYRRGSLLILVPAVVVVMSLIELRARRAGRKVDDV